MTRQNDSTGSPTELLKNAPANSLFTRRDTCRICHGTDVVPVIELAPIPITTPNVGLDTSAQGLAAADELLVPLDLYRCGGCGHLQLLHVIKPEVQYGHFRYTTSISLGLPAHFQRMTRDVIDGLQLRAGMKVIEIGSNDGTLLRLFKDAGMSVLGVDPATAIAGRATNAGIETLPEFFAEDVAAEIMQARGRFDLVIANNTLANIDDLDDCLRGVKKLLAEDGVFVFETSYGADVIEGLLLDTIYHEHLSYFLVQSLPTLFQRHGMELFDVRHIPTKGGSLRGFVQHAGAKRPTAPTVRQLIDREHDKGLGGDRPYRRFRSRLGLISDALENALANNDIVQNGIAGYGASVGSVTLIHQFGLAGRLDFIVDDKPLGTSITGPGYDIPIVSADALYAEAPAFTLLLAWRYGEAIISKHQSYLAEGGKFIVPLPKFYIRAA